MMTLWILLFGLRGSFILGLISICEHFYSFSKSEDIMRCVLLFKSHHVLIPSEVKISAWKTRGEY